MVSINEENQHTQEDEFLDKLKEDLQVLENSWKKRKLQRKKVTKHFVEIIDSILDIARSESVEPIELVCAEFKGSLLSAANGKDELKENTWRSALELIDLLKDSLSEGDVPFTKLEEWQSHWKGEEDLQPSMIGESSEPSNTTSLSTGEAIENRESLAQEENEMVEKTEAEKLLQEAQEALLSGNGDNAKELALKAAELIAKLEVEEVQRKEKLLRADLENTSHLEAEAEETLKPLKEELADRERELASMNSRLTEAKSSLEERLRACQEIKEEIDKTETELASLKEKHANLLAQFQEALPARDAAERECSRLEADLETLAPDVESMKDSISAAETQLEKARQKRAEIEAELEKLIEKTAA